MPRQTVIGVDIGTQGTKAVLFIADGKCLATAFAKSRLHRPAAGVVEEDPEFQLKTVCQTVTQCVNKSRVSPSSVAAIGIDGQMAGVIGVGADGKNVTPYDSWLDTRCAPYIRKMQTEAGREVLVKAGCVPSFNHGPKKLWWMHERRKTYRSIRSFVQPAAYVAMRLCGLGAEHAFIDTSYLHFSGFANNRKSRWDLILCKKFNLDPEKLPRIVASHDVIGELTSSMARRCGLAPGIPVVAGCGDTAASFLACGATREGVCVDVAGTASVFCATTKTFRADWKSLTLACGRAATPGLWHQYAYINGGGMNIEWFRKEVANAGRESGRHLLSLGDLNKAASVIQPEEVGPMFVPHLGGRVCPSQPDLRGAWIDLNWSQSVSHLYRAVLEGIALEYGIYKSVLHELYPKLKLSEIRITGGGGKSPVWNQIKADILQTRVVQIAHSEGAPMGAAMLAGFGVGLFKSLPAVANRWVQKTTCYKPEKKHAPTYQQRVSKYRRLLDSLNQLTQS